MKIVIVTDAWRPQINGVVTTLTETGRELERAGHDVHYITPDGFRTMPCPTYPEIRLSLFPGRRVRRRLDRLAPDVVHIATEGPLGFAARRYCKRRGRAFTTSYHTRFPQYLRERAPIPLRLTFWWLRRFHRPAHATMVPTPAIRDELTARGFANVVIWGRGVDTRLFRPEPRAHYELPGPLWIYAGRIAVEKNLEAFLDLKLPGSKILIGDGPDLERLRARYPAAQFLGYRFGEELACAVAGGDVFVFPSRTDTFGLVMLEAMACGLPVAAFPVAGPVDVVTDGYDGILADDLADACRRALELDREQCRMTALKRSWQRSTEQFLSLLPPVTDATAGPAQPSLT